MPPTVGLARLAEATTGALPPLDAAQRRVALGVYRLLSRGTGATPEALAAITGLATADVADVVAGLPTATVVEGTVVGFLGLQLAPTTHRITFDPPAGAPDGDGDPAQGAWCAFDTLFLPGLLGAAADVASRCPVTGAAIAVRVDPVAGVVAVSPATARLSFLDQPAPYAGNLVASFCRWVHFLRDPDAAAAWAASAARDGGEALVTLELHDGVELARRTNRSVFGVEPPAGPPPGPASAGGGTQGARRPLARS